MAVNTETRYTLELFPTSQENWDRYKEWFQGEDVAVGPENAGVDLLVCEPFTVEERHAKLMNLGVKARMIKHWPSCLYGQPVQKSEVCNYWLAPRSSIYKTGLIQANSLGIIDRSYRGVLMGAAMCWRGPVTVDVGQRLYQILAPDMGHISRVRLRPTEELDETVRGTGGFGSTGK